MPKRNRALSAGLTVALTVAFGVGLSGCASSNGCHTGTKSAPSAVKGLIESSAAAKSVDDVCRFTDPGSTVTMRDITKLRDSIPSAEVKQLSYKKGEQLGTDAPVAVSSPDGTIHLTLYATSDDHNSWTVEFGSDAAN